MNKVSFYLEELFSLIDSDRLSINKFVFRGQGDKNWNIQASLFRDVNIARSEHELLEGYLNKFPEYSSQSMINTFADMQHYGIPTRLVDWTTNPLIALFFACNSQPEKDGRVFFYPRNKVMNSSQSHAIANFLCELGGFNIQHKHAKKITDDVSEGFRKQGISEESAYIWSYLNLLTSGLSNLLYNDGIRFSCFKSSSTFSNSLEINNELHTAFRSFINQRFSDKISKDLVEEIPYFLSYLDSPYCFIDAPRINNRIIAQCGLFQVSGIKFYKGIQLIHNSTPTYHEIHNTLSIIIKAKDKSLILDKLDKYFNINPSTLYLKDKQQLVNEFKLDKGER